MAKSTQKPPPYDMPNMTAVANETRPYTDPRATYKIAEQARNAQTQGTQRRRPS